MCEDLRAEAAEKRRNGLHGRKAASDAWGLLGCIVGLRNTTTHRLGALDLGQVCQARQLHRSIRLLESTKQTEIPPGLRRCTNSTRLDCADLDARCCTSSGTISEPGQGAEQSARLVNSPTIVMTLSEHGIHA